MKIHKKVQRKRLIADLLEVLQQADDTLSWAQHCLNHPNNQPIKDTIIMIRAAIAKARVTA
jgi:hypothetical protein